ncbi:MAG: hypothetical protein ACP5E4_03245 [Candidatus Aenigmatarchaeota archaeon]
MAYDVAVIGALLVFGLLVYLFYRAVKLLVKFIAVVGIFAIFPVIMVKVFNVKWNLSLELVVSFAILGVLGFAIYYGLSVAETFISPFVSRMKRKLKAKAAQREKRAHKDKKHSKKSWVEFEEQ